MRMIDCKLPKVTSTVWLIAEHMPCCSLQQREGHKDRLLGKHSTVAIAESSVGFVPWQRDHTSTPGLQLTSRRSGQQCSRLRVQVVPCPHSWAPLSLRTPTVTA